MFFCSSFNSVDVGFILIVYARRASITFICSSNNFLRPAIKSSCLWYASRRDFAIMSLKLLTITFASSDNLAVFLFGVLWKRDKNLVSSACLRFSAFASSARSSSSWVGYDDDDIY